MVLVLLDPNVALDTVDHVVLLGVVYFRSDSICMLRTQLVQVPPVKPKRIVLRFIKTICSSSPTTVLHKALESEEFVIYTVDIAETIAACWLNHHLYVDDTQHAPKIHAYRRYFSNPREF